MHLTAHERLGDRRKDYRIIHRRLIALLHEEYSEFNIMRRYFTKEKPPLVPEFAQSLGVSTKTIRRHLGDISQSDMMVLTGMFANTIHGKRPDDFSGILSEIMGINI